MLTPAPVVKVDKKSNYKISEFFLNDLTKLNVVSLRFVFGFLNF